MEKKRKLLKMEQIDKRFPGVHALNKVNFDLYEGEVHIVLGENGAGKSTLMKIISGSIARDNGRVFVDQKEISEMTPESSQAMGIGMVYQELSLIPSLSVAENIFLGKLQLKKMGVIDWRSIQLKARESLSSLGVDIPVSTEVRHLSVAEQQLTEIARILTKQPKIILLDEPTSALSDTERDRLFDIIRRLQKRGVGIVYISHRLEEVPLIGQRVTVLRDGCVVGTLPIEKTDEDILINMMVGRKLTEQYTKSKIKKGNILLKVEDLTVSKKIKGLSFELHRGEILGIFGIMGAGQTTMARAIFGLLPKTTGGIMINGSEVKINHPHDAIRCGIGLLTSDRREGLVYLLNIAPNITLARVGQNSGLSKLDLTNEDQVAQEYINDLHIQPPNLKRKVMFLSGGNQQKVVISRWLFSDSRILIFDEPTRGIDVGAKAEVFSLMDKLARRGVGIIMISSEMQEIIAMADRILVMRNGEFKASYDRNPTQDQLLRSATID